MAEDVTYADLKFGAPLEHHTKKEDVMYENFDGLQIHREKKERGPPPKPPLEGDGQLRQRLHKWYLPLCLVSWLLFLLLLIGVIVLAVKYSQNSSHIDHIMASLQRELSATKENLKQVVQVNTGLNSSIQQYQQDVQRITVTRQEAEKKVDQWVKASSYLKGAARGGDKIFISRDDTGNWEEAVAICRNNGGQLAMPRNHTENQAVLSIMKSMSRYAFLGFNDRLTEGVFRDLNGAAITYTNWNRNQPDNHNNEDCIQMLETGQWNDLDCAHKFLVICEFI